MVSGCKKKRNKRTERELVYTAGRRGEESAELRRLPLEEKVAVRKGNQGLQKRERRRGLGKCQRTGHGAQVCPPPREEWRVRNKLVVPRGRCIRSALL